MADDQAALELPSRRVRLAREAGALTELSLALDHLAIVHVHAGDLDAAAGLVYEADRVSALTGQVRAASGSLMLAAWRGAEAEFAELVQASRARAALPSDGHQLPHSACAAAAVLHNGLGHYHDALAAARRAGEHDDVGSPWVLAELVDAAARAGELDDAVAGYERLAARTRAAGTEWALGIQARARAVISDGDDADKQYRTAIERLGRCRAVPDLARAHLLYGEWLRRRRRRLDACPELHTAHQLFSGMGAAAFARRAADELLATGARARRRTVDEANALTPRKRRWPSWPKTVGPTRRLARSSSSAHALSSTTCARSSTSSALTPAANWPRHSPHEVRPLVPRSECWACPLRAGPPLCLVATTDSPAQLTRFRHLAWAALGGCGARGHGCSLPPKKARQHDDPGTPVASLRITSASDRAH